MAGQGISGSPSTRPARRRRVGLLSALAVCLAVGAPQAHAGIDAWTSGDQPGGRPSAVALAGDLALAGITGGGSGGNIHRSSDGGATWTRVDGFPPADVFGAAVHPSGLAFAATRDGLFRSADGGVTWAEVVPTGASQGDFWFAAEIDQSRPSHVFAVRFSVSGGGVWRSTNGGLGGWTQISAGLPNPFTLTGVVVDPVTHIAWGWGNGVYALLDGGTSWGAGNSGLPSMSVSEVVVDAGGARVIALAGSDLVWLPSLGGPTWQPLEGGLPTAPPAFYGTGLTADAAGNAWTTNLFDNRLWRLPAGGATWAPADTGFPGSSGTNGARLTADRATGGRVLGVPGVLNQGEGSLWRTADAGGSWSRSSAGYRAVEVSAVAADPRVPGRVLAATESETVQRSLDGGATWLPGATGLPAFAVEDVVADGVTPNAFYASTNGGGVFRSSDGGASWAAVGAADPAQARFLGADPNRAGLVYVSQNENLWRSSDAGALWVPLPAAGLPPFPFVRRIVADPTSPGAVYRVGERGVFRLAEGAPSWTARNTGLPPDVSATDLAIDPRDPSRWVLATTVGVWRSADAGGTWTPSQGIPTPFVPAVVIDPQTGEVLASAGTRIYRSGDGGATFTEQAPSAVVPSIRDFSVDADGRTIYGATSARGVIARTRAVPGAGPGAGAPGGALLSVAGPPRITGRARVASSLRVVPATFRASPAAAVVTRWQRCRANRTGCAAIAGATGATYRVRLADVGRRLRVVQTATNPAGSTRALSAFTAVVAPPAAVLGTARVGAVLRAAVGATGLSRARVVRVRWQRCTRTGTRCRTIPGAVGRVYRPSAADAGRRLRVVVTVRAGARRVVITALPGGVVRR